MSVINGLVNRLPERLRKKVMFRLAVRTVPMMQYVRPSLVELSDSKVIVRVDLSRRTRNLHASMFLGAFSVAADCVAGVFPIRFMFETGHRVAPIVKTTSAEFHKRVTTYAHFICTQGEELTQVCKEATLTGQRIEMPLDVIVIAPKEFGDEPVAKINLMLSIKRYK